MNEQWPPLPQSLTYTMSINLDGITTPIIAEIWLPPSRANKNSDISSFRYSRLNGDTPADIEFRKALYAAIGAVAVASGHAESAMKRVILVAESRDQTFGDIEQPWSTLVNRLKAIASSDHELSDSIQEILDWSSKRNLVERRNSTVHSYWWHWAGVGLTRSRFTRDGRTFTVAGNIEGLSGIQRDADLLFEYARRLDDLVLTTWPQARFLTTDQSEPSAFREPTT